MVFTQSDILGDVKLLKPVLRAYALGYVTVTGPRLLSFVRTARRADRTIDQKFRILYTILKTSTQLNRFPTACAIIISGITVIPRLLRIVLHRICWVLQKKPSWLSDPNFSRQLRYVSSFLSAWIAFDLLNQDQTWITKSTYSSNPPGTGSSRLASETQLQASMPERRPNYAGKTIDFTLFAFLRALDVAVVDAWTSFGSRPNHSGQRLLRVGRFVKNNADSAIFAFSAAVIMWSWFYSPYRLPRAYNGWISQAADIDSRLIKALRLAREGEFVYGQDTGQAHLLEGLCKELSLPKEYADPAITIPIPCELYHCGLGKECETHAISRLLNSWRFAMKIYLPLQIFARLPTFSITTCLAALRSASQSSSFLAAFVALFYYSVCLARTRLGPKLFSKESVSPQMWDSGLCVLTGCLVCGWSILLEKPNRRQEIAFFVAPRAVATLLPRAYNRQYRYREQMVFASSIAVVLNKARDTNQVRGVLGRVLGNLMDG